MIAELFDSLNSQLTALCDVLGVRITCVLFDLVLHVQISRYACQ